MVSLASLPLLGVRVVYLVLGTFQVGLRFNSIVGSVQAAYGMQFAMKLITVGLFMTARMVHVPLGGAKAANLEVEF